MACEYDTPDSNGDVPDMTTRYKVFQHIKSGGLYVLTDYVMSSRKTGDVWEAFYTGDGPVAFTREIRDFFDGRFAYVKNAADEQTEH